MISKAMLFVKEKYILKVTLLTQVESIILLNENAQVES